MKVVILAGGFGTRLSEYTDTIPKPMIPIGNIPIIHHIMNIYASYGHKEFYIALGYKGDVIKEYFSKKIKDWKVNLIDTGSNTYTGGRVKRLKSFLNGEAFFLTYGDGLSDININSLLTFHKSHKKMVTISAVRPPARFGSLSLDGTKIVKFKEKIQLDDNWVNGGFFIVEPNFLNYIKDDTTILEKEPLEKVVSEENIRAFKHEGFWQCMDHKSDKDLLEKMLNEDQAPWLKKKNY
jgi:glucose-1-phosphate cytidylyltransferase